jgi:hypothetical protein
MVDSSRSNVMPCLPLIDGLSARERTYFDLRRSTFDK